MGAWDTPPTEDELRRAATAPDPWSAPPTADELAAANEPAPAEPEGRTLEAEGQVYTIPDWPAPPPDRDTIGPATALEKPEDARLRAIIDAGLTKAPDQHAGVLAISKQLGVPAEIIEARYPEFKAKAEAVQLDPQRLRLEAPELASFLLQRPQLSPLIRDDAANLSSIEWALTGRPGGLRQNPLTGEPYVEDYVLPFWGAVIRDAVHQAEMGIRQTISSEQRFSLNPFAGVDRAKNAARIEELKTQIPSARDYGIDEIEFKPARALAHAIADIAELVPMLGGTVATAAAGGAVAGPVGAFVAPFTFNYALFKGPGHAALREEMKAQGKEGDPDAEARAEFWSTLGGSTNAILATAGGPGTMAKGIGAKLGLGKLIAGGEPAVAKLVQSQTVGRALARAALERGAHFADGVATMAAMSGVSAAAQEAFRSDLAGDEFHLERVSDAMVQAAEQAVPSMLLLAGLSTPVRQHLEEIGRARAISAGADRLEKAVEAARASKTFDRAPDDAQDLAGRMARAGDADVTFLEKAEFDRLYQEQGANPRDVAARFMGDGGKAWDEANATGADLPVPTATFLKMARSSEGLALTDIARLPQQERTPRQARENAARVGKRIKEQAEAAVKAGQATPRDQVFEDFKARALAAGRSKLEAEANAEIVARAYTWMGAESNQDPIALYKREAPAIFGAGAAAAAAALPQAARAAAETPEFKAWFGKSTVVDEKGAPLVVYHGTGEDFAAFDLDRVQFPRGSLFATSDPALASSHAQGKSRPNVMPLYAAIERPATKEQYLAAGMHADTLRAQGFDGAVWNDGSGRKIFVAFEPRQFKSVFNRGTFDPADPNILHQEPRTAGGESISLAQGKERGFFQVTFDAGGEPVKAEIHLENPDRSTLAHELMHSFTDVLGRLAQQAEASPALRESYQVLLRAMGFADHRERQVAAKERRELAALEKPTPEQRARLKALTAREERVSHQWEQFLAEGKAPTKELLPVFARFKVWLGRIYRGLEGIRSQYRETYGEDLKLSDEVRDVFRRMLGGDDAVANAARDLEAEQPAVKLTPKEQEEADRFEAEARDDAAAEVQRRIASEEKDADREFMKSERARLTAEVDAEVGKERTYAALDALTKGEVAGGPMKLDRAAVVKDHGAAVADALPKDVLGTWAAVHPDVAASLLGFDSGQELVRALVGAEPKKDRVAREVAQRMRDLYPSLTDRPRLLAAVAKGEIHNAAFLRAGILRLRAMAREAGLEVQVPTARQLADAAERMVRDTKYSALRPDAFDLAARGAARRASEATDPKVRQGEYETYLLNRALYRAALDARAGAEKDAARLALLTRPGPARRRIEKATQREVLPDGTVQFTNPHLAMIDELLGAFEFKASATLKDVRSRAEQRAALEKWVAERQADGEMVVVPASVMKGLERTEHWKDLTPSELEDLRIAVDSIAAQAELRTAYKLGQQKMAHEEVVAKLVAGALEHGRGITTGLGSGVETVGEKLAAAGRSLQYMLERPELLFRALDGHKDGGSWQRLIWNKLSDASYRFYDLQREAGAKVLAVLEAVPAAERAELKRKDIVTSDGGKYSGENVIGALANCGNESNLSKMLRGMSDPRLRQFGEVPWNGRGTLDELLSHATPRHVEIVNAIHQALETHWEKAVELEKTDSGVAPKKVATRPFTFIGKDGQSLTIDGGYYPVIYSRKFRIGKEQAGADTAGLLGMPGLFNRDYDAASTPQGYLQERIESYSRAFDLSLEALPRKLVMQAKDIAFRRDAKQVYRVLTDDRVIGALHQAVGEEGYDVILAHLKESVNDVMLPDAGAGLGHALIRKARGLVSEAIFGLNIQQTLQNLADLTGVAAVVPMRHFTAASLRITKDIPGEVAAIQAKSAEMRLRADGHRTSVARALEDSFRTSELAMKWDHAKELFMIPFETTNAMVEMPVWRGAYDHALESTDKGGLGLSDAEAIRHADSAVRTLFGGKRTVDLPPVSRDKVFRHLTMFYGWANSQLNLFMRAAGEAGVQWGDGARLLALKTMGKAFALLFAKQIASELLSGRAPEDSNKDGELDAADVGSWLAWRAVMASPLGNTPVVGPAMKNLEGGAPGRDVSVTPWLQLANAVVRAGQATHKATSAEGELTDEQLTNLFLAWLEAGGQATGAPVVQLGATARYWTRKSGNESPGEDVLGTMFGPKRPGKLSQAIFGGQ